MNEIKVTVTYDKPTTSKFDALMAEYEAAKKYADETVSYYKPLADVAEEAKMLAILEQLETIKGYAKKLSMLYSDSNHSANICAGISSDERGFYHHYGANFEVCYKSNGTFEVTWANIPFTIEKLRARPDLFAKDGYNILGNWDKWQVYQRLEKHAHRQILAKVNAEKNRAEAEIKRLNNITKGGI